MKKIDNYDSIEEASEGYGTPEAGGYVCMILGVEDVPFDEKTGKGNYLKVMFDFAEGEFAGHFSDKFSRFGNWPSAGYMYKSYNDKSAGFFKAFISSVEKSNPNYKWAWDEKTLKDKWVGVIMREEEYFGSDGSIKTRLKADKTTTVDAIRSGDFKVPPKKYVNGSQSMSDTLSGFTSAPASSDNPFA